MLFEHTKNSNKHQQTTTEKYFSFRTFQEKRREKIKAADWLKKTRFYVLVKSSISRVL